MGIWDDIGRENTHLDTGTQRTDPLFVDKVIDIAGRYLNPPDAAMVQCVAAKIRGQAQARS
jgi:hypothetical protein